jgi:hypothetical protein
MPSSIAFLVLVSASVSVVSAVSVVFAVFVVFAVYWKTVARILNE